jgi:hypothetical protein
MLISVLGLLGLYALKRREGIRARYVFDRQHYWHCDGGTGGLVAVSFVLAGMTGTTGALVASLIGTLIATIVFTAGLAVLRRWGYIKQRPAFRQWPSG